MAQLVHLAPTQVELASSYLAEPSSQDLDAAIAGLQQHYLFRPLPDVVGYLRCYPRLIPVLNEAATLFARYFGPDAALVLELLVDPESEIEFRSLYAIVLTSLDVAEADVRFDRLLEEWWLDRAPHGPGILVIDWQSA
jgi:hypothetical protein